VTDFLSVPADREAAARALLANLAGAHTVALSTHINADGDGCGSEVGFAQLLMQKGFDVYIVNPTPWPAMYEFLLGPVKNRSAEGARALSAADRVVVLDISDVSRLGGLAGALRARPQRALVIDHHLAGDEPPGDVMLSDVKACATGELVYDFAVATGCTVTPPIATALYAAILTDTGGFRYANTSPRSHAVAAALLQAGVDPEAMYRRIYASVTPGRLHLLRDALATLTIDTGAGIASVDVVAGALEKYGLNSEDLDGIAEYPRSIAGTKVAMLFRDLGHGKVKVSFRSIGGADVNALARQFGGGGHARASGALISGTLESVRTSVLAAARVMLGK
jgi:phosphoesterase RecJ-like protein